MRIGLLHSTIREDEKWLLSAAEQKGVDLVRIDMRAQVLNPDTWKNSYDAMLQRCVSSTLGLQATLFYEAMGLRVVNTARTAGACENKFLTSLILRAHGIPTPPFAVVFSEAEALKAVEELGGYPVVLKPLSGSWGRLIAKINDQDALEGVIEQRMVLGSPSHKALYLQKYVEKNGRDIRVLVVGERPVAAMYRETPHWITNMARGAQARPCAVGEELRGVSLAAAKAVGGGVLGIDVFETEGGYQVNEINHTPEFKNVQAVSGEDVAGAIIDYCIALASHGS